MPYRERNKSPRASKSPQRAQPTELRSLRRIAGNLIESIDQSLHESRLDTTVAHHGWSARELTCLSSLLHLIAIVSLDKRTMSNLAGRRNMPAVDELKPGDIQGLMDELFERARASAPLELKDALPAPVKLKPEIIEEAIILCRIDASLKDLAVGYAYQTFAMPQRREAQDAAQAPNKSFSLRNLVSFTQLYTPSWVVDFLIARSFAKDKIDEDFAVIDPACGGGHFLVRAFDEIAAELTNRGHSPREVARQIAARGIAGVDIDPIAVWISSLSLTLKAISLDPAFSQRFHGLASVLDANEERGLLLGTLDRRWSDRKGHPLSTAYDAVITNPPYLGRKLMSRQLKQSLKSEYPDSCHDICTAFIRRSLELLKPGGKLALITQSSLLYLPSSEGLRKHIVGEHSLVDVVEAGTGVFPLQTGEKVDSVLLVIQQGNREGDARFIDLRKSMDKERELKSIGTSQAESASAESPQDAGNVYFRSPKSFLEHSTSSFNYSCPSFITRLSQNNRALDTIADVRQGLATSDNERFVRFIWDVDPDTIGSVWHPYAKGAGAERWFAPILHLVKWGVDGSEIKEAVSAAYPYLRGKTHWVVKNESYYFREGLTFSFVGGKRLSVRHLPPGCIFDVGASAIFARGEEPRTLQFILAYLNSSSLGALANVLNPTINFQVGDIKRLALLPVERTAIEELAECGSICADLKREITSWLCAPALGYPLFGFSLSRNQSIRKGCAQAEARLNHLTQALTTMEQRIDSVMLRQLRKILHLDSTETRELDRWLADQTFERTNEFRLEEQDFASRFLISRIEERIAQHTILLLDTANPSAWIAELELSPDCVSFGERALKMPIATYFARHMARDLDRIFRKAPPYLATSIENTIAIIPLTVLRRAQSDLSALKVLLSQQKLHSEVTQLVEAMNAHTDWSSKTMLELARKRRLSSSL